MDGEWRIAFIAADKSKVNYGVAPIPVADDKPNLYGAGYITGNVIGISRGSKNPEAAWEFIKYLTTDTDAVVKLANGIKNVPTTDAALNSPNLTADAELQGVPADLRRTRTPRPRRRAAPAPPTRTTCRRSWTSGRPARWPTCQSA